MSIANTGPNAATAKAPAVSDTVVIMSRGELEAREVAAYKRGYDMAVSDAAKPAPAIVEDAPTPAYPADYPPSFGTDMAMRDAQLRRDAVVQGTAPL